ncbi:hypothetical protein [Streptomyces lasiicapitis]|uniref:hypothetical protein n=1 Tax=Streptomyces lasiicapitis TaxID=1923961 RepID=UPI00365F6589
MLAVTTGTGRARGARMCRTYRVRRAGAGVVLAVLTAVSAVGCGGSDEPDGKAAAGKRGSKSSAAQSSGSPSASAKPSVSAADGDDVGACADGNCEVAVSDPVTVRFKGPRGRATLTVTEVGPNKVEYAVKSGSGRSKGGASGPGQGCITVLRSNGSGNSCGGVGDGRPSAQPDAVVIQMAGGQDGTAILHIVSN